MAKDDSPESEKIYLNLKKEFVDTFWKNEKEEVSLEKSALEVNPEVSSLG